MSHNKSPSPERPPKPSGRAATRVAVATLIASGCLGLAACGSTDRSATARSPQEARAAQIERKEAIDFVRCARKNGLNVPAPDAQNRIKVNGLSEHPRRKAIANVCYHKVIKQDQRERRGEGGK